MGEKQRPTENIRRGRVEGKAEEIISHAATLEIIREFIREKVLNFENSWDRSTPETKTRKPN